MFGPINLKGNYLTFDTAQFSSADVKAVLSGAGGLIKTNAGTLTLYSNNTYTGTTTLSGGLLQMLNGALASPILLNLGTLHALGTVGTITSLGSGSPGSIVLSPGGNTAILTCSNVLLNPATTFVTDLNGTTAGSGYDQLNVHGTVALNNATLAVTLGYAPAIGDRFIIINNDASDAVSGRFSGLPEGGVFTNGTAVFQITYRGGDGNDVVVTRVNPPARLTSITALSNGAAQIQGLGLSNLTYTIQATTNLNPVIQWSNLGASAANSSGVFSFTDTNAPLFPKRFYRVLSP